ncbi:MULTISPECIES: isocitrate lyase/PEP mutase family protein [Pseudonocardia]|uniref:2-methylisocitrate lyase n=2 Tax=Pseudonocardia TaxID=1847 RepID=A0A1Y2N723_PSEAH|nr:MULTISPECIES: oxaloacetate decarboxylase [Pseudonocardia]OSY43275.1 2,3-dimethylmalate lyase [Pseudonocardia autotrophica]TDN71763.1 2,3-dimethylmalate lyase [Pseudonocardia autotrophica]BBG02450.1 carboxyvinyl-carboxyphosphonate phosphorylmutase [Pseudonocardia autotrophica]GEC23214.1 carboxyvinyl-carboxyphosphonate phosphorylmutase [Pseudonocardia saturnea]
MGDLLSKPGDRRARLRALLDSGEPLLAPGAYDALSARLVEQAGFGAVYMTGFGSTAGLLGRPDVGLLGGAEMAAHAARLADAVDLPLIADADTGYGNPVNVIRTVRDYERAGVAALHMEDQVMPKRCGHMSGKQVVPAGEMAAKIRAAVDARSDPDLLIIARTDAAAVDGLDAAVDRAKRFADAGADLLFVEAPTSEAHIEQVASALQGHKLVFNWAEGGRTPPLSLERLAELGFALVLFPIGTLLAATAAMGEFLRVLRADGTPAAMLDRLGGVDPFAELVGLGEIRELEERYRDQGTA